MLSPTEVKEFYDGFGARQDRQGFYEDRALDDLFAHSALGRARRVVEFGCGTGRFAARVLAEFPGLSYAGFDVSTTMVGLARERLARFGERATIGQLEPGTLRLPLPGGGVDRVLSTYVLDLLPASDIAAFFTEAGRLLDADGLLGVVSLARGPAFLPRLVSGLWGLVFRVAPGVVGGCRPIELAPFCDGRGWETLHRQTIVSRGISSEVLVARPLRPGT